MEGERWPRQYAADFIAAGSDKEKQRQALAGCPVEFRDIVRIHIENYRCKIKPLTVNNSLLL